jgi:hypothetical protein
MQAKYRSKNYQLTEASYTFLIDFAKRSYLHQVLFLAVLNMMDYLTSVSVLKNLVAKLRFIVNFIRSRMTYLTYN